LFGSVQIIVDALSHRHEIVVSPFRWAAGRSPGSEVAVPIGGGHATIHEKVTTGDEAAVRSH
jgi:hypothetical protein